MAAYSVKTKGNKELQARLALARESLGDFAPAYKKSAVFLDRWVQKNFKSEGGLVGLWASFLSDNPRLRKDPSAKLLQDTGRGRLSFIPFASKDDAGIGTELEYMARHNRGDEDNNLPQRRILPEPSEIEDDIVKIFDDDIDKDLKNVGLI